MPLSHNSLKFFNPVCLLFPFFSSSSPTLQESVRFMYFFSTWILRLVSPLALHNELPEGYASSFSFPFFTPVSLSSGILSLSRLLRCTRRGMDGIDYRDGLLLRSWIKAKQGYSLFPVTLRELDNCTTTANNNNGATCAIVLVRTIAARSHAHTQNSAPRFIYNSK